MLRPFTSLAAIAAIGLIAGCGGSGSAPSPTQPRATGGGTGATQSGKTRASISLVVRPSKASKNANVKGAAAGLRKRAYISPKTQGVIAEFAGSDGSSDVTYQGYTLSAGATQSATSPASCGTAASDGSFTCTLYFALAPGITYTTTLTAYDAAQSGTSEQPVNPSSALSTATQSLAITSNTANTFSFTLAGIVEGFNISPQYVGVAGISEGSGTLTGLFQALDADDDPIDQYDTSTAFVYGPQPNPSASPAAPGGPFVAASFPVVATDYNGCDASTDDKARKRLQDGDTDCLTTTSTAVSDPASETVSYAYDGEGEGGDGVSVAPYYGEITLTPPANYGGFVSNGNAASLFIVPFFGVVDSSSAYEAGTASVDFTAPGQTITGYATQYHPPTSAPADGSGYTVDASSCEDGGEVQSVSTPVYSAGYGISFTITSGGTTGTCTLTLSDDATASTADTATIDISNTSSGGSVTVPSPGPTVSPNARKR